MNGLQLASFFAFDKTNRGGVNVAVGDVDGDGQEEIVASEVSRGSGLVKVFTLDGVLKSQFYALGNRYRGGVKLATGDLDADARAEIILTPTDQQYGLVKVMTAQGIAKRQF